MGIAERLHEVMRIMKWNKKALAKAGGVLPRTVSRWMKEEVFPSDLTLKKISKNSKVSILYLKEGEGPVLQKALWAYYARQKTSLELQKNIYRRLDELIAATGLNKAKLAEISEIITETFLDEPFWIGGSKYRLSPHDIEKIASATKYNKDWLWYGKGKRKFDIKNIGTAENNGIFESPKGGLDQDEQLARMEMANFKNQCPGFFDEFFEFIADEYGPSREGVATFLEDYRTNMSNSNYRTWLRRKKQDGESDKTVPADNLTANSS